MIDFKYLRMGLDGLANAHRAGTMAGHLGAALVAGYFFGEDQHNLDQAVYRGIEKELDRILAGEEAIWFNAKQAGLTVEDLFREPPEEEPQPKRIPAIAQALAKNIGRLRQSGHNVIFAALALRAFEDHPDFATPQRITGVEKLITGFNQVSGGRGYFGKQQGWRRAEQVKPPQDEKFPPFKDQQQMAVAVLEELIAAGGQHRQGFGGLWHVINHAAGVTELSRYGYQELAQQGLAAQHQHVQLWRMLPDLESELGVLQKSEQDPRQKDYWTTGELKRDQARLTHRIKTLYGFFTLERSVEDAEKRKQAEDHLRYLMA